MTSETNDDSLSLNHESSNQDQSVSSSRMIWSFAKQWSEMWKEYDRVVVNGLRKAECKHCHKKLVAESNSGTSHLRNHLYTCPVKNADPVMVSGILGSKKRKIGTGNSSPVVFDQETSRRELACMIVLHEFPLSVVDYVGFRRFVYSLQPMFQMFCRNTIKSDILKIFKEGKMNVMHELEKVSSRVAITTDMWTSSNKKRGFMVVTTHFINDAWVLQSRILSFILVPSPHTKDVLCSVLLDCMTEWDIERKVSTVTVDNCSTNDAMIRILLGRLQEDTLLLKGSLFPMRCAAHILNLIVQDGLSVIENCIERIRDSVVYWTSSTRRRQKFSEVLGRLTNIDCSRELVLDCKTRWNSTYLMLSTALIYKDVFHRLIVKDPCYVCFPSEEEWDMASELCLKLKLFHEATETFSGITYPTANTFFPMVCEIKIALSEWRLSLNVTIATMAEQMLDKFNRYWEVIHGTLAVAAILDPRFKMKLLEWAFPQIYVGTSAFQLNRIQNFCYDIMSEYKTIEPSMDSSSSSSLPHQHASSGFLASFDSYVGSTRSNWNVKEELDKYLRDDVIPRSEEFDILSWWKNHGLQYPILRLIAKDILAIPVSTIVSESAFSTSGRLLNPHRSRLDEQTVEALMCTQNWLMNELRGVAIFSPGIDGSTQTIFCDNDGGGDEGVMADGI